MVGHQAVSPDLDRRLGSRFGEQIPAKRVVGGSEEDGLSAITALGYVMRKSRSDDAAEACHADVLRHPRNWCNRLDVTVIRDSKSFFIDSIHVPMTNP
jgi:hypothetical protein